MMSMKILKDAAKAYLKKIFSDLHNVIISVVIGSLILGTGATYIFLKNTWKLFIYIVELPTPLWATISLLCLSNCFIYFKISQKISCSKSSCEKGGILVTAGGFKWLVSHSAGLVVHAKGTPYFPNHDMMLVKENGRFVCPVSGCLVQESIRSLESRYKFIESEIEKTIREL